MSDLRTNDNDVVASKQHGQGSTDYIALNSLLNFYDDNGKIQFDKDKEAARQYFLNHVNSNMQWFHSLEEKLEFLLENEYYERDFIEKYSFDFVKELFKKAYAVKFRFPTFVGAYKFYNQYAMKTFDGKRYLERYEDRISIVALYLARGDQELAENLMYDMVEGRYQPATPTFLNSGKKQSGDLVSCFPAGTKITIANGLTKNIEDLKVGDEVLTHTGEIRSITKTIINPNEEHMITLKPANAPAVTMTGNHPVLIWTDDADDRETIITSELPEGDGYKWVAARDVRVNSDHVVFVGQNITTEISELSVEDFIELLPARNGKNSVDRENYVVHEGYVKYALRDKKFSRREGRDFSTRTAPVKNAVALDYDFGRFMGYYLSEGYASSRHQDGVHNSVVFTFGSKEQEFIQDVVDLTQKIFGLTAKVNYNYNDNSAKISINSVLLAEMIYSLAGTGYDKKALSDTLFKAGESFLRGLLVGSFRGDGCTFESRVIMDLVNPELIRQLRTLALSYGLVPGIRDYENSAGNVTSSLYFNAINSANQDLIYEIGKNLHRFIEPKSPRKAYTFSLKDGNVVSLVVGKDESEAVETVYNLEVEEDHTYLAEGTVVHNCFLIDIQDNMESISRAHNAALQLSKRGGGVALQLSNLRNEGAPIKKIENQSSGVIPVMKMLEDAFSYANQLGQRQGSGAVYLHAHHPDIEKFLDTRRENADEKIRIKTLSLGIVVPDITFKLAAEGKDMYLFSPYDVERIYGKPFTQVSINEEYDKLVANPEISKKKLNARKFFQNVAEIQFESGYPYILFEDNANRANPIDGRITMSNLCVTGDTAILTDSGYRNVRELYETQEDFSVIVDKRARDMDFNQSGVSAEKSSRMKLTAEDAEIFKMSTAEGAELRATAWHKMYAFRDGEVVKLPLAELEIGDKVLVQPDEGSFGNHHDTDLAYLAGLIAADGSIVEAETSAGNETSTARVYLYDDKQELEQVVEETARRVLETRDDLVERQSTLEPKFSQNPLVPNRIQLHSAPLAKVFAEKGITKASKLTIPQFVKEGDKETQLAYLSGLFQMDSTICGSVSAKSCSIELSSTNRQLLVDVQRVLLNLGVYTRIYVGRKENGTAMLPDGHGGHKEYNQKRNWSLRATSKRERDHLYDLLTWREAQVSAWDRLNANKSGKKPYETHKHLMTVTSIEFDGLEDVYDVTVDNGHSLIFNGISTGNCSEILQTNTPSLYNDDLSYDHVGKDISCNLGSLNIAKVMETGDFAATIENSMRSLSQVSDLTDLETVPSIRRGNNEMHSVGLGAMNLHGYLAKERIHYGSKEGLDFTNMFFYCVNYYSLKASSLIAQEKGEHFAGFENSEYASGKYFDKYLEKAWEPKTDKVAGLFSQHGIHIPTQADWEALKASVQEHGVYSAWRMAVAPTGSISYVSSSTQSILPQSGGIVEARKESKMGRVYYPAPYATNDNTEYYANAYELGHKKIIDTYAVATQHIDQGASCTLHLNADEASTRTLNQAQIYAWKRGLKTLYYVRVSTGSMEGTDMEGCVSCSI